eukprot:scaffold239_cov382-Pavlova_lutheri.AAC.14
MGSSPMVPAAVVNGFQQPHLANTCVDEESRRHWSKSCPLGRTKRSINCPGRWALFLSNGGICTPDSLLLFQCPIQAKLGLLRNRT